MPRTSAPRRPKPQSITAIPGLKADILTATSCDPYHADLLLYILSFARSNGRNAATLDQIEPIAAKIVNTWAIVVPGDARTLAVQLFKIQNQLLVWEFERAYEQRIAAGQQRFAEPMQREMTVVYSTPPEVRYNTSDAKS